jgi:signal peptidase
MTTLTKYLPTRKSNKNIIFIIATIIFIYILDNFAVKLHISRTSIINIIEPILWISISVFIWRLPSIGSRAKLRHKSFIHIWAFIFSVIYILLNMLAGFFDGLGKSPYNHTFQGVIMNLIVIGATLIGREFIRSYLINSIVKKENYMIFVFVAFFMTITTFSINKYSALNNLEGAVTFLAQYFMPEFSYNLFASYLVFLGGPLSSIIYLGITQLFHWMSPVLPNLKWINAALIGILSPVFFLMSLQSSYTSHTKEAKKSQKNDEDMFSWIITSVVSIMIIWFTVGVFPIYPSVIITGSMEPQIKPGDVILVKKISSMEDIHNLKINDVIQFQRDGVLISHRILEIKTDEEKGTLYKTKGDNNSGPDTELVKTQDIKGTIKYTVPKIGWLTLLIKSDKEIPIEDIVY